MQDVAQAKILVYGAEASIVDIQRQREQQENALCILLGRNPGSIQRGSGLTNQQVRAEVPAGLPSSLLERRPDIQFAEQLLVAANADIGQAKAAFYPQLTLTGALRLPNRSALRPVQRARADLAVRSGGHVCRCSPAAACART